ncbi:Leucine aminopeptidase 1 [Boothiomyces sp. JEL0838]|nr:Leucine aminopeptidase 1 [Boothiomyces sp. JEL0838]
MLKLLFASIISASPLQQRPLFSPEDRLISTSEGQSEWMSEMQIFELYKNNVKFIDITDGEFEFLEQHASMNIASNPDFPTKPSYQDVANKLIENIDTNRMEEFLTAFSGFHTRYFKSDSGKESSQWLYDQLESLPEKHPRDDVKFTVSKVIHDWKQFSVTARFESVESEKQDIVVLSAHQDSVNQWNPWFGRSPGADDDGSGTTTIFEALTVLWNHGFVPKRPLEFHFYSAEEGGLLGSQKVVAKYVKEKIPVYAVFHNDMTGYQPEDSKPIVAVNTDNVNGPLTKTFEMIATTYAGVPWEYTKCGYACSDHASWTKAGIPSTFTFEAKFEKHSPFIHTTQDTVEHIDFKHMSSFVNNIFKLYRSKTKFIDLTDGDYSSFTQKKRNPVYPTKTSETQTVNDFIKKVSTDRMETFLTTFSGFHTRYYNSKSGKESSQWLFDQLSGISGRSDVKLTVTKFEHSWQQFSVICRFEKVGNTNDEIVILSAHQDSVNQWNPCGADDDGSGTTTVFEALTVLYENGFVPDRPLEFHFYSGEEGGLLGSQKVVKKYVEDDVNVYAVLHNDMTGYQPDGIAPVIGISTDNVDKKLSKVLQIISDEYAGVKWVNTKCGYACSDHASWTKAGIPAAFTFEAAFENQRYF